MSSWDWYCGKHGRGCMLR